MDPDTDVRREQTPDPAARCWADGLSTLLSQREAVERFTALGLDRESARRVLVCGLVPPVRRGRGTTLYDEGDVVAFLDRQRTDPPLWRDQLMVVLRTHPRCADADSPVGWSGIDLMAPPEEQLVAARAGGRGMSGVTQAYVALRAQQDGTVPMLATVGGRRSGSACSSRRAAAGARGGSSGLATTPSSPAPGAFGRRSRLSDMNPRQRRLVIPVALAALILIVVIAALV